MWSVRQKVRVNYWNERRPTRSLRRAIEVSGTPRRPVVWVQKVPHAENQAFVLIDRLSCLDSPAHQA